MIELMTEAHDWNLKDEVIGRARPCDVCGMVIPLAAVALVLRDRCNNVVARACSHRFCRARVRERFAPSQEPFTDYVN